MPQLDLKKIFVANRQEVLTRLHQTFMSMNIQTVAPFVNQTECFEGIEPAWIQNHTDFMSVEKMIGLAKKHHCQAIHPGWGFLSEQSQFSKACEDQQLMFIGPNHTSMNALGDKFKAKQLAKKLGIRTLDVVGESKTSSFIDDLKSMSFPIILKSRAGGGGKGMTVVHAFNEIQKAVDEAKRLSKAHFNDDALIAEPYIDRAYHVEVQVLGHKGGVECFIERDCSIQRRHQKIIEESPSLNITQNIQDQILSDAKKLIEASGYQNAGTVEFILNQQGEHFFMEVNTRLQVEHGVTELLCDEDLVQRQIEITLGQDIKVNTKPQGHVIEVRVYAENPYGHFAPSAGKILKLKLPLKSSDVRVDHALKEGDEIHSMFDPMLLKVIVKGQDRKDAIHKLKDVLFHTCILGIDTNLNYLRWILSHDDFLNSKHHTQWCNQYLQAFILDESQRSKSKAMLACEQTYIKDNQNNVIDPYSHLKRILHEI